ncbi:MAG: hypothetical protein EXR55_06730 [Dehalococcoidia bacterium]|nr:hypothetical protein [Dehalococcoidia bacterium]
MSQAFIPNSGSSRPGDQAALEHFRAALESAKPWPQALLEAMAQWASSEEVHQGRRYRYLIDGEAFDWLLLAERLCAEADGLIPDGARESLLFFGRLPEEVSPQEFRRLLGPAKYSAYLNFYYGVMVEEALQLAVEEEVHKERHAKGFAYAGDESAESFERLYQGPQEALLAQFLQEKGYPDTDRLTYGQYQDFTYWLFKHRLKTSVPPKVASDTRKGLQMLEGLRGKQGLSNGRRQPKF